MKGMNKTTGKHLEGIAHLKQSITDILTTPIGTRVMRRDYGSRLFELVDRPITDDLAMELYAATAAALNKWEPRFKLEQVQITSQQQGNITLMLRGLYLPNGKNIQLDNLYISYG